MLALDTPPLPSPLREGTTTLRPNGGGEGGGETAIKKAFTLAEVLITLVVIGVVAAITVPVVSSNVNQKTKAERVSNIRHKFSKGTDAMLATVGMNGYGSTMEFAKEFAKHFKISKICDNDHIADCWPTEKVITDGKEWDISKTKTASTLKMPKGESVDWDNTVGIITNDGTGMILTYNKKCDISFNQGLHWNGDNSSSNTCVAAVFDWNGGKKPNTFGSTAKNADIYSINTGGLGMACAVEANGKCFTPAQSPKAYSGSVSLSDLKITNECTSSSCKTNGDRWAGAAEMCGGRTNLPDRSDLEAIASQLYDGNGKFYNKELALAIGIPEDTVNNMLNGSGSFRLWLSVENSSDLAYNVFFYSSSTSWGYANRYLSYPLALCLGG